MQLTSFTDYTLRVLIFLGSKTEKMSSVSEIAGCYNISKNHIVKVVHNLAKLGYINSYKGKGGGICLAMDSKEINIGTLVKQIENFPLVECFRDDGQCPIVPVCKLKGILFKAQHSFIATLSQYTLADVIVDPLELQSLFNSLQV